MRYVLNQEEKLHGKNGGHYLKTNGGGNLNAN